MKKIGKKEIVLLVLAILVFLSALGYFCYKEIPELIKPKVYYRTYTKEKGWTKWSKNGETSGNKHDITAIQIKIKNMKKTDIHYEIRLNNKMLSKNIKNNQVIGNKKDAITAIGLMCNDNKYKIQYRFLNSDKKWYDFIDEGLIGYNNSKGITKIQFRVIER